MLLWAYFVRQTEPKILRLVIATINQSELLVPVLVYSVTYITGLIGNILILVAVTGQKQVGEGIIDFFQEQKINF